MRTLTGVLVLGLASLASADTIRLKNGGTLEGVIVKEAEGSLVVRLKYATVTLEKSEVDSVEKSKELEKAAAPPPRLARWEKVIEVLASRPWAGELRQIPATVIDKGVLKNVPYMSHKSGNTEFNLYGDPDDPAGLEIGVYKELLKSDAAKKECLEVLAALLGDTKDVASLRSLGLGTGKKERDGLVFEITPETAEDAYGGWWITVYDPKLLEEARAGEEELKQITITEEELAKEEEAEKERLKKAHAARTADPKAEPKKPEPAPAVNPYPYARTDVRHARVHRTGVVRRFYVRGYHRPKGGHYTRPGGIRR